MIKAIVFDLDGTLADTLPEIREGVNMTMRKMGYPEHDLAAIRSFINFGARHLIRCALPAHLRQDEEKVDEALALFDRCYGEVYLHTQKTYDGMKELVSRLHRDYKVGVLSNKQDPYVKQLAEQLLGTGNYDAAQGVIFGLPTKPNPYLSEKVAEAMGVDTRECIMVGDSDIDIRTAQNANMTHVGVAWGFRDEAFLREHQATHIAHTAEELEALIRSLCK